MMVSPLTAPVYLRGAEGLRDAGFFEDGAAFFAGAAAALGLVSTLAAGALALVALTASAFVTTGFSSVVAAGALVVSASVSIGFKPCFAVRNCSKYVESRPRSQDIFVRRTILEPGEAVNGPSTHCCDRAGL
jgi:hypothetical protein